MEPLKVYRIVRIPSGKCARVFQSATRLSRRKLTQASYHPKRRPACSSYTTSQDSDHDKETVSNKHHKSPRSGHHDVTILCPRLSLGLSSCPRAMFPWPWLYLALVLALGRTALSQRTSWVYQSQTPYTVQKDFQKFVEEAGGNSRRFKFFGNFFNSDEHGTENDTFLENTFLETPFQNEKQGKPFIEDFPSTKLTKPFVDNVLSANPPHKKTLHDPPPANQVPPSFYGDIFDHSLPVDSPYRTTFLSSPRPEVFKTRSENKRGRENRKLEKQKMGFLSESFQPFSEDLLTPLPFQKHTNIEGFTSQTLGNIEFSKRKSKAAFDNFEQFPELNREDLGSFSDEIRSTENEVSRFGAFLRRRPFFGRPRRPPRKLFHSEFKHLFSQEHDSSLNLIDSPEPKPPSPSSHAESHLGRPDLEAILSDFEETAQNDHVEGGVGFPVPLGHSTSDISHNSGSREKAIRNLVSKPYQAGMEDTILAAGCPAGDILYGAGAVWFERGCQRNACVHFRGRFFVETDSCDSEIRNTSYRCVVLVDTKASYPDCCPRYQCHPDNLGQPLDTGI